MTPGQRALLRSGRRARVRARFRVGVQAQSGFSGARNGVAVGRVEWAALEGGEVETVLANLLYNQHSRAVRVRPAQGDFGIDVIVPATPAPEPWNVYQIK